MAYDLSKLHDCSARLRERIRTLSAGRVLGVRRVTSTSAPVSLFGP